MIQTRCIAVCRARHFYYVLVLGLPEGSSALAHFLDAGVGDGWLAVALWPLRCVRGGPFYGRSFALSVDKRRFGYLSPSGNFCLS
jgi:hypothetical protein